MLFGNRERFGIEIRPVSPGWERRYRPERAGWAGLMLWTANTNLCRHVFSGSEQLEEELFVPVAPLADWFVSSWSALCYEERAGSFPTHRDLHADLARWAEAPPGDGCTLNRWLALREEWWARHFVAAGADGAILPNVALVRDDEELAIACAPARIAGERRLEFQHESGAWHFPWLECRETVRRFLSFAADWLRSEGQLDLYRWVALQEPLGSDAGHEMQNLEYYTGRSMGDLHRLMHSTEEADLLSRLGLPVASGDPATSPIAQVLRDLPPCPSAHIDTALDLIREHLQGRGLEDYQECRDVARDAASAAISPEDAGHRAAASIRRKLALDGGPIGDTAALAARAGARVVISGLTTERERMVAGTKTGAPAVIVVLETTSTRTDWGRRFEACRGLGHLLLDPLRGGALGAASSPYATETRRRRSCAFAAELLLPESALAEASGGRLDGAVSAPAFRGLMARYGVGARTAAHQLWNRHWLSSPELRDELIDAYGAEAP